MVPGHLVFDLYSHRKIKLRVETHSVNYSILHLYLLNACPCNSTCRDAPPIPGQAISFQSEVNWLMKPLNTRFLTVLTTLAFLGFTVSAVADPCQPGETPEDHKHCRDGGDGGNANGLGSNISMDCLLGASWGDDPDPGDTIKDDGLDVYQDAVDKVDCSIRGPSIPGPYVWG